MTSKHCSGSKTQDAGDIQIGPDPVPILRFSSPFMPPHQDTVSFETPESSPALEAHTCFGGGGVGRGQAPGLSRAAGGQHTGSLSRFAWAEPVVADRMWAGMI